MNISLVGMMGSGKTTVGKMISELLSEYTFIDTDEEIVKKEHCSINEIFKNKGEAEFRLIETGVLENVLKRNNQIISTGGGIILSDYNIKLLNENSNVFYLYADENTLYERVKNNKERPLLNNTDMKDKIKNLMQTRKNRYEKAHYLIDTTDKTPKDIALEILRKSGLYGNN